MEFKEFVQKLASVLRSGNNVEQFTRIVFEAVVTADGKDILEEYSESSYKAYYYGITSIRKISQRINTHVDFMEFSQYINQFSDAAVETLCNKFREDIPDITPYNAGDKLGQLFISILSEAAGTKNNADPVKSEPEPAALTAQSFDQYISKATAFYSDIKTLFYSDQPRSFRDVYVCNDLKTKSWSQRNARTISNVTVDDLRSILSRVIITGTGGIGKSMMMRHLFFDCADNYQTTGVVPILLLLRNYKETYTNLADVLYEAIAEFTNTVTKNAFETLLATGKCVILLDGLDETIGITRTMLLNAITGFIKKYPDNLIVVSSRPNTAFQKLEHFITLELAPFEKDQAMALIDHLDYYDETAKEAFKADLDARLYQSYIQFASNPLLLTIMMMTHVSCGTIPAKQHLFYEKAYEAMASLHYTAKSHSSKPMHTGLDADRFASFFAEFCARTYRDRKLHFTEREFCSYMDTILAHRTASIAATSKDFLRDLTDHISLLYREGEYYYFIHRSFQEYFCARFFANQPDDHLHKVGDFFETQENRITDDYAFDMLYNMIPDKIDRYVLLPHLQQLWETYDNAQGYQSFLTNMYTDIYITQTPNNTYVHCSPVSFLYAFIIKTQHLDQTYRLRLLAWPPSIALCGDHIESTVADTSTIIAVSDDFVKFAKLYADPDRFAELIAFIESDDFPLKQEYNQVGAYIKQLEHRCNHVVDSDDWFDDF